MSSEPRVVHDPEERVFAILVEQDEVAGYAQYEPRPGTMALTHVIVEPPFAGLGYGAALVEAALGQARQQGLKVLPLCSFALAHVRRNPRHLDLVPQDHLKRLGLAA